MSKLDNRIPPPILMLATGAAMVAASQFLPPVLPGNAGLAGAVAITLAAGAFGAPAFAAFGRAGTTINPVDIGAASKLVTGGVYKLSRNPMYVALTLLLLALAVGLGNMWLGLGPLAFALFITRFQIMPEERIMAAKFGAEFAAYRGRVRRWL